MYVNEHRKGQNMNDMKLLLAYVSEHKIVLVTTALGMLFGAFIGVLAFQYGWLG